MIIENERMPPSYLAARDKELEEKTYLCALLSESQSGCGEYCNGHCQIHRRLRNRFQEFQSDPGAMDQRKTKTGKTTLTRANTEGVQIAVKLQSGIVEPLALEVRRSNR